jgi:hypothetical protein
MTTPIPGLYQHYKGWLYELIGVWQHTETWEQLVIYRSHKNPPDDHATIWLRPLQIFLEDVVVDGVRRPRFVYRGDDC